MGKSYRGDSDFGRKFEEFRKSAKKKTGKKKGLDINNNTGYIIPNLNEIEAEWNRGE